MTKELFVSSSPPETKVAVFEDDQLVEVYYEREADVGLAGSIYKGRVSRVLPGMQSAFVNIGLERDAFLYVSDFVEDEEEYDKIFSEAEARATRFVETGQAPAGEVALPAPTAPPGPTPAPEVAESSPATSVTPSVSVESNGPVAAAPPPAGPPEERHEYRRHDPRRGRRRRGRDFRYTPRPERHEQPSDRSFEILPGESLAKYREAGSPGPEAGATEEARPEVPPIEGLATAPSDAAASAPEAPAAPPSIAGQASKVVEAAAVGEAPSAEFDLAPAESAPSAASQGEATMTANPPITAPEIAPSAATTEAVPALDPTGTLAPIHIYAPVDAPAPESTAAAVALAAQIAEPAAEEVATAAGVESAAPLETSQEVPNAPGEVEASVAPEGAELGEETLAGEEGEAESAGAFVAGEETGSAVAETLRDGESPASPEEATEPVPATDSGSTETPERKYTLREPHQRPRFAPRRRRGRRGMGGGRRPERYVPSRPGNDQPVQISDLLKEGQEIIVQIAKEPLGTKGARITSHVALPGRYLVFMPTIDHIGVSRKITSEEERFRLRNIILENRGSLTGGFIVRTAGAGRSEEEFKADLRFLATLWNEIKSKAERLKAPALLHRDLNLVQRILRDILSPDFKQIRVDSEAEYERCVEFVNRCQPSLVGHVKLYMRDTPMFEEFGIQQEVDKALRPKVWLKSGGYIVINQTEALVAIDVNTGKYVGKTNRLEDTIVKTNIDAVNEIVRQIRLRDLGGIIVIDFIDMDERKNRMKVVQALEEALRRDRAPTKVLSFNDFGLVAVTRKRVKQSLERTLSQPCNYCGGSGWTKSVTTVCYEILDEAKKMARHIEGDCITLRVHPDVAQALKSRQSAILSEIEALTHKDVIVKGDAAVHQERFEVY